MLHSFIPSCHPEIAKEMLVRDESVATTSFACFIVSWTVASTVQALDIFLWVFKKMCFAFKRMSVVTGLVCCLFQTPGGLGHLFLWRAGWQQCSPVAELLRYSHASLPWLLIHQCGNILFSPTELTLTSSLIPGE